MTTELDKIREKHPNISPQDAEDLKIINESLDGLSKRGTFASQEPYVLTIPQQDDVAYVHRNSYQAKQFAHNTPFHPEEREEGQWLTYIYHEPGMTMFKQHPSTEDSRPSSVISTPAQKAKPKKVMSLGAYKQQKLSSSSPAPREEPVADRAEQARKAESEAILAAVDEAPSPVKKDTAEIDGKRKRHKDEPNGVEPVTKRARTEEYQSRSESTSPTTQRPRDLPGKLSPLRERERELPNRLSPTLPINIETALYERKHRQRPSKIVKLRTGRAANADGRACKAASPERTNGTASSQNKTTSPELTNGAASRQDRRATSPAKQTASQIEQQPVRTPSIIPTSSPETQKHTTPSFRKGLLSNGNTHTPEPNTPFGDSKQRPNRTPAQQQWNLEQSRLEKLGRDLKHTASDCAAAKPAEPQRAAVRALQSFTCYLLAFTCADQVSLAAEPPTAPPLNRWRSLELFSKFVLKHCEPYPALTGVAWMLCMVYNSHMLHLIEGPPADTPSRDSVVGMASALRKAAANMYGSLAPAMLRQDFPRAWKAADKSYGVLVEDLKINMLLEGGYQLPATLLTTPVQAARAAIAIIDEWAEKQGMDEKIELMPAS